MATAAKISDIRQPSYEPQSARVTVLMTPDKKAQIEADAARLGISSGEYIRLAVDNFGSPEERQELELLTSELSAAMPGIIADFDAINQSIAEARAAVDAALRSTGARH